MSFLVVGCSFRTARLDLRERLAFNAEALEQVYDALRGSPHVDEAMVVSTCNRVELYAVAAGPTFAAQQALLELLGRGDPASLTSSIYRLEQEEALLHIYRVAASLDAMVVGEAQIMGQVKDAFATATAADCVGPLLTRCMQRAFLTAKRVRTETAIARFPASVSSVAIDMAAHIFADLAEVATLVVGAGEMAELAVRHLVGRGTTRLRVANRDPERARQLCAEFEAQPVAFDTLEQQLAWADVVISSTGSSEPIVSRKQLANAMRRRKQRPLFIVDIAVPRDVESSARTLPNLYLFDVDDLERVVAENIKARRKEAAIAERIVSAEVRQFTDWLRIQRAVPVIKQLRQHFADVAHTEAERAARRIGANGVEQRQVLDQMADAIVNKLLHTPTVELKKTAAKPSGPHLTEAARQLFALETAECGDEGEESDDGR